MPLVKKDSDFTRVTKFVSANQLVVPSNRGRYKALTPRTRRYRMSATQENAEQHNCPPLFSLHFEEFKKKLEYKKNLQGTALFTNVCVRVCVFVCT